MKNNLTRTTVLLDKDLAKLAKMKAASESLTLSKFITRLIAKNLEEGGVEELIGAITSSQVIKNSAAKNRKIKGLILARA